MVMPQKAIRELAEIGTVDPQAEDVPAQVAAAAAAAAGSNGRIGERLRAAREAAGCSIVEVFAGTKVKIALIEAIEAGDRTRLPATPFTAGFVKAYAQFLGLDAGAYAALYRAEVAAEEAAAAARAAPPAPEPAPRVYQAPLLADLPAAPGKPAVPALPPEKLVSYIGIGASLLAAGWIGAMVAAPKRNPAPAIAAETVAAAAPESAVVAPAPAPAPVPSEAAPADGIADAPPAREETPVEAASDAESAAPAPVPAPRIKPPAPVYLAGAATPAFDAGALNAAQAAAVAELPAAPVAAPEPKLLPARLLRPAAPKYPERCAARARARESVDVLVDIGPDGTPQNPRAASTSNACFNPAAFETALKMRFAPATADGAPRVETARALTVEFLK